MILFSAIAAMAHDRLPASYGQTGRVSKGGRPVKHFSVAKRPAIDLFKTSSDRCSGASLVREVSPQVEGDSLRKRHGPVLPGAEDAETPDSGCADRPSVAEGPVIDLFRTCSSASSDSLGSGAVSRREWGSAIVGVQVASMGSVGGVDSTPPLDYAGWGPNL
jgi:hypothetical protein